MSMQDAVNDAMEDGTIPTPSDDDKQLEAMIPGPDGKPEKLLMYSPTLEQIAWITALANQRGGGGVQDQIAGTVDLMEDLLTPEDFSRVWKRLRDRRDPLRLENITDALSLAMEAVQDFPTQPSSDSSTASRTPKPGRRSTGRASGPGSIRSASA